MTDPSLDVRISGELADRIIELLEAGAVGKPVDSVVARTAANNVVLAISSAVMRDGVVSLSDGGALPRPNMPWLPPR
jgi:hypothetical protein